MGEVTGSPDGTGPDAAPAPVTRPPRTTALLYFVYALWFLFLLDPQWLVAAYGVRPILKVAPLAYYVVLLLLAVRPNKLFGFLPLAALTVVAGVGVLLAPNPAYAIRALKLFMFPTLMAAITLHAVRHPKQAIPILGLMITQYVWWAFFGMPGGRVAWHQLYSNYDGYGPLMASGIGLCYYAGLGARPGKWRWIGYGLSAVAVGGVVASFARGAVLSMLAVLAVIWWHSPRKGKTTAYLSVALVVVMIGAGLLSQANRGGTTSGFWNEMRTIFKGTSEGTGHDRKVLWTTAIQLWKDRPLLGVGGRNFGVAAAMTVEAGTLYGRYANPYTLYDRVLHNIYVQLLAEHGLVGSAIFIWLVVDFYRKNRDLRRPRAIRRWAEATGDWIGLKELALGLQVAWFAFMVNGVFYDLLFVNFGYAILVANVLLHKFATRRATA